MTALIALVTLTFWPLNRLASKLASILPILGLLALSFLGRHPSFYNAPSLRGHGHNKQQLQLRRCSQFWHSLLADKHASSRWKLWSRWHTWVHVRWGVTGVHLYLYWIDCRAAGRTKMHSCSREMSASRAVNGSEFVVSATSTQRVHVIPKISPACGQYSCSWSRLRLQQVPNARLVI